MLLLALTGGPRLRARRAAQDKVQLNGPDAKKATKRFTRVEFDDLHTRLRGRDARPLLRAGAASQGAVNVIQQCIDRSAAPCRIRLGPPIGAEASTHLSFGLVSEVVHRGVDKRDAGAFGDGVPSAQNPRRP
jgi:hypothetical protein